MKDLEHNLVEPHTNYFASNHISYKKSMSNNKPLMALTISWYCEEVFQFLYEQWL